MGWFSARERKTYFSSFHRSFVEYPKIIHIKLYISHSSFFSTPFHLLTLQCQVLRDFFLVSLPHTTSQSSFSQYTDNEDATKMMMCYYAAFFLLSAMLRLYLWVRKTKVMALKNTRNFLLYFILFFSLALCVVVYIHLPPHWGVNGCIRYNIIIIQH